MTNERAVIGDNSGLGGDAARRYQEYVQRLERLADEKDEKVAEMNELIADLKTEIKSKGYDMKALAEHMRRRKWAKKNSEAAPVLEVYEGVFQ